MAAVQNAAQLLVVSGIGVGLIKQQCRPCGLDCAE
jgi:hypothetical protein